MPLKKQSMFAHVASCKNSIPATLLNHNIHFPTKWQAHKAIRLPLFRVHFRSHTDNTHKWVLNLRMFNLSVIRASFQSEPSSPAPSFPALHRRLKVTLIFVWYSSLAHLFSVFSSVFTPPDSIKTTIQISVQLRTKIMPLEATQYYITAETRRVLCSYGIQTLRGTVLMNCLSV